VRSIPVTITHDTSLPFVELDGYRFHVRTFGDADAPTVVVVHGGPGGDLHYLLPLRDLAREFFVIFYDQRGTGLSPRVAKDELNLDTMLDDLHRIIGHYAHGRPARLIGHSWGAMLAIAYAGRHPGRMSHVVAVEPGMLNPVAAAAYVEKVKASLDIRDRLSMLGYITQAAFIKTRDGHERLDFVMTRMLNRNRPGGPYQCAGESMPAGAFVRAGFDAFFTLMKPVLDDPGSFHFNLAADSTRYAGGLLLLSSECSIIGYRFQEEFHLPSLPPHTLHVMAKGMGHNMLTLNPAWSIGVISDFFGGRSASRT
jgi:proline iminopeptidase